jgi:tetratricopeptide (TPR) repeat protein/transposase-like protein
MVKDSTLAGWCKGFVPKEPELVVWFTRFCVRQGRVDRQWAEALLRQARYPEREQLLGELFPAASLAAPSDLVRGEESANGKQTDNPTTPQFSVLTTSQMNHEPPQHSAPTLPAAEQFPPLWQVPYPRNPHFTGRDELLDQLDQHFFPEQPGGPLPPHPVALTQPQAIKGLGGIGKTQIALEYAYRARERHRYTHTFWINAASSEALMTSFIALVKLFPAFPAQHETNQHQLVAEIKGWLGQCQQPWLLIFDNVDDLSLVQEYFPTTGNGSIILTTRANAVGSRASSLEVETLGFVEGTQFLLRRAGRLASASEEEINEAGNLVVALDQFPLALDQAGAYIEETGCRFSDYVQLYQERRQVLLARRGAQATSYPDSVATTWSLSFQRVEQANPAAAELLRLCAFLAPDHIPEELFKAGAAQWPPVLQQASVDLLAFNQMVEELLRFSLVKRLAEHNLLSLHRLVQVVQQDALPPEEQRQWAERVVRAVHTLFPADPKADPTCWPQCLRYLEQAQACDRLIAEYRLLLPEAAEVLDRAGTYLSEHASYTLAESLFQRALSIREVQSTFPLNRLADLALRQGKYEQAESLYQRTLAIREQYLGPEHPLLADPLSGLGHSFYYQGNYEHVERLYQRAISIREQQLGDTHPLIARLLSNLARFYTMQGRFAEAEPLFQRARSIQEQQLGDTHLDLAGVLYGLAELYREQKRLAEAEPLFQHAISIRDQQLGETHPDLALLLYGLAQVYSAQNRYEQAEPLYQRVLVIWEQQLGLEHSQVAYPLAAWAELAMNQGKYVQAKSLYLRALAIWEQQLGEEHALVAYPLAGLVKCYQEEGRFAEAEPLLQRALHILEHTGGDQPLITAQNLDDFAAFRTAQHRYEEAMSFAERALAIREQVLGAEHPQTKEARQRLRVVLDALASTEAAEKEDGAHPGPAETKDVEKNADMDGDFRSVLPVCPYCQSADTIVKSGTNQSGSRRFRCQRCQRYFTPQATARGFERTWKEQAILLAGQGKSYRFIARQIGVNHRTIRTWIKSDVRNGNRPQQE